MRVPLSPQPLIIGDFPLERFLRDYWQQKALFLPGALVNFRSPLSADEFAGLALEPDIESRLIERTRVPGPQDEKKPWTLREGPFLESDFQSLGEREWTLLIQDVDKFVPEVARLLSLVEFLPRWSIDDIMVSYAAPGGSVGPHTDQYDVFLVQALGTRRWELSTNVDESCLRTDTDLKVLEEFDCETSYEAGPGDVLYIPPGVGHFGVAQDECLTYSFGFRAPTGADLLTAFSDRLIEKTTYSTLKEKTNGHCSHSAQLSPALLHQVEELIRTAMKDQDSVASWLGRHLTQPKENLCFTEKLSKVGSNEILQALNHGMFLSRSPSSRFLFAVAPSSNGGAASSLLFIDGEEFDLSSYPFGEKLAGLLCEAHTLDENTLSSWVHSSDKRKLGTLLASLHNSGFLTYGQTR